MTPGPLVALAYAGAVWLNTDNDDALREFLELLMAERRDAYLDGQASIKEASLDIYQAADWKQVATDLYAVPRIHAHRVRMQAPRENDYQGRRTA